MPRAVWQQWQRVRLPQLAVAEGEAAPAHSLSLPPSLSSRCLARQLAQSSPRLRDIGSLAGVAEDQATSASCLRHHYALQAPLLAV